MNGPERTLLWRAVGAMGLPVAGGLLGRSVTVAGWGDTGGLHGESGTSPNPSPDGSGSCDLARRGGKFDWSFLKTGLIYGFAARVCSAFCLVRGAVSAGNPIYPLAGTMAGQTVRPGFTDDDWFPKRTLGSKVGPWGSQP